MYFNSSLAINHQCDILRVGSLDILRVSFFVCKIKVKSIILLTPNFAQSLSRMSVLPSTSQAETPLVFLFLHPVSHQEVLVQTTHVFTPLLVIWCRDSAAGASWSCSLGQLSGRLLHSDIPSELHFLWLQSKLTWTSLSVHSVLFTTVCVVVTFVSWVLAQCLAHSSSPVNIC